MKLRIGGEVWPDKTFIPDFYKRKYKKEKKKDG